MGLRKLSFLFDFVLLPVLNVPLSRILAVTQISWKVIYSPVFLFTLIYLPLQGVFLSINKTGFDIDRFIVFYKPFLFAFFFYSLGSKFTFRNYDYLLKLGLLLSLFLNLASLLYVIQGGDLVLLFAKLNFAAMRGDLGLINTTRVSLPFVNPVRLSLFAGICFFYFRRYNKSWLFLTLSILLLVWSGSRTGLIAVIFAELVVRKYRWRDLIILGGLFTVLPFLIDLDIRIFDFSETTTFRHVLLRTQTLTRIGSFGFVDWLFGIGLGQSIYYIDGVYSFTVILTLLFETGLIGAFLFIYVFVKSYMKSPLIIFLFLSCLFYELKAEPLLWVTLGLKPGLLRSFS